MNAIELAERLHGREIGNEITREECESAKDAGLVVVFGASDDLIKFRGAIDDEGCVYNGGTVLVSGQTYMGRDDGHDCDCDFCGFHELRGEATTIKAKWCDGDVSWSYDTDIPHETFDVMEDGEVYCRGLVFSVEDA